MAAGRNVPVLVGAVPLMQVQTITISEGYRVERIAGSAFSQAVSPSPKSISIDAVLTGRARLLAKKGLEVMAFTSRAAVAAAAPLLSVSGIPVISAFTIALDMQITDLKFTQSATKRDAVDVAITLVHVPRSAAMEIASEIADLALAAGTARDPDDAGAEPDPAEPETVSALAPRFLTLPIEPDEGFPQSFRLELEERLYVVTLYVNVSEPRLEATAATALIDLGADPAEDAGAEDAHMVVRLARESDLDVPRTIFLRKVVPGIVYAAEDLLLRFDELVVARANLNAAGPHGSRVRGGVALAWAS